jgi:hypothetical protein
MLVACRLASLSALETYHAGAGVGAQCGAAYGSGWPAPVWAGWARVAGVARP